MKTLSKHLIQNNGSARYKGNEFIHPSYLGLKNLEQLLVPLCVNIPGGVGKGSPGTHINTGQQLGKSWVTSLT